jgi:hypothetical protein
MKVKIEFLFLKPENTKCGSIKTFKNHLQTDSDIIIKREQLKVNKIIATLSLVTGLVMDDKNERYFLLKVEKNVNPRNEEKAINDLSVVKEKILGVISNSGIGFKIVPLYDDVSFYYSKLSYPLINEVENSMRQLIYKFMITNLGSNWLSKGAPSKFNSSVKNKNKSEEKNDDESQLNYSFENILHNIDFIQINHFLFTEYTINLSEIYEKIKKAKKNTDLTLPEIKEVVPKDNWSRYFSKIIQIPKFMQNWARLYELRCLIAHNNLINKSNYDEIVSLCDLFGKKFKFAIYEIDKIKIPASDKEELSYSAATSFLDVAYPNVLNTASGIALNSNLINVGQYSSARMLPITNVNSNVALLAGGSGSNLYSTTLGSNLFRNHLYLSQRCSMCNKDFVPSLSDSITFPFTCNDCRNSGPLTIKFKNQI